MKDRKTTTGTGNVVSLVFATKGISSFESLELIL
jgi:hypothetical protein